MTSNGFLLRLVGIPLFSRAAFYAVVGTRHAFFIFAWRGRTGNNVKQLTNAIVSAKREGGWMVVSPPRGEFIKEVLRPPFAIVLDEFGKSQRRGRWGWPRIDVWHGTDKEFPKEPWEELETGALLRRYFRRRLRRCLADDNAFPGDSDDSLIIHVRSGDIFTPENFLDPKHRQAPCAYFRKIIREGNHGRPFSRATVLTEADRQNPCAAWLEDEGLAEVRGGEVWEDACSILRARNLVVARSSFSETLARLSVKVRRVFTFDLKPCCCGGGDPMRQVFRYEIPGVADYRPSAQENRRWMLSYPEQDISGPFLCNLSELRAGSY